MSTQNSKRIKSSVMGLAIGDSLGVPAEFMGRDELRRTPVTDMRGGGAHGQTPGTWSDDTSLTVALMESLCHGIDFDDQMQRFTDWMMHGAYSAHDELFDIGGATRSAIFKYAHEYPPLECGGLAENSCGNGSLMRILPAVLYLMANDENSTLDDVAASFIHDISRLTHGHLCCLVACGIYTSIVFELGRAGDLSTACKRGIDLALAYYGAKPEYAAQCAKFSRLADIAALPESEIESSGYVLHTLEAALWCLLTTSSYSECVLRAVNLGRDTDTTAAVAGSLAGLWYGYGAIPEAWLSMLVKREYLEDCCNRFAKAIE